MCNLERVGGNSFFFVVFFLTGVFKIHRWIVSMVASGEKKREKKLERNKL